MDRNGIRLMGRVRVRALLGVASALMLPMAQADAQPSSPETPPAERIQLAQAAKQARPASKGTESGGATEAQLRQRVEQLEEQFVDMQVLIGTLESLARNPSSAAPSMRGAPMAAGMSGADAGRIDALETQVRALTAQIEQLSQRGASSGGGGYAPAPIQRDSFAPSNGGGQQLGSSVGGGFGATIVTPGGGGDDQIGRFLNDDAGAPPPSGQTAALAPPSGGDGNSKQAYETAYGYLLQQNYSAAEGAFDDFLQRYPGDPLAGNAQYWLGESLFVRGQFKAAATAFLKGYQTYGRSAKAPDSLLKLAMSLDRLGQRDAACSSYAELNTRFPNAPSHVKTRAQTERQRAGC